MSSVLARASAGPTTIAAPAEFTLALTIPAPGSYLVLAKLGLVNPVPGSSVVTCALESGEGVSDSIVLRLGSGFETANTLMLPHAYAAAGTATLRCAPAAGESVTVSNVRIAAIATQALVIQP